MKLSVRSYSLADGLKLRDDVATQLDACCARILHDMDLLLFTSKRCTIHERLAAAMIGYISGAIAGAPAPALMRLVGSKVVELQADAAALQRVTPVSLLGLLPTYHVDDVDDCLLLYSGAADNVLTSVATCTKDLARSKLNDWILLASSELIDSYNPLSVGAKQLHTDVHALLMRGADADDCLLHDVNRSYLSLFYWCLCVLGYSHQVTKFLCHRVNRIRTAHGLEPVASLPRLLLTSRA